MKSEKAGDLHDKSFWNVNLETTFLDTKHNHKVNKNSGDSSLLPSCGPGFESLAHFMFDLMFERRGFKALSVMPGIETCCKRQESWDPRFTQMPVSVNHN